MHGSPGDPVKLQNLIQEDLGQGGDSAFQHSVQQG